MIVSIKDTSKLFILSIMSCCAVFICTLFLNYQSDLIVIEELITPQTVDLYNALKSTSIVVCALSGGCLIITSVVMMIFYVKHYIDFHKKELGILKALGYTRMKTAIGFWKFGVSVFIGTVIGFIGAFAIMPLFYKVQNKDDIIPEVKLNFHPELLIFLVILPSIFFVMLAVFYAFLKLKTPVLSLIKDNYVCRYHEKHIKNKDNASFIESLKNTTVKSRKSLVFFVIFSSFCYSAMTQMSFSMKDLASDMIGIMMLIIGLTLAFVTMFLAITTVISANRKTIAMMRVFGYTPNDCRKAILGGYRLFSYIGFAIGTVYQYILLRVMVNIVFANFGNISKYEFNFKAMLISLMTFAVIYKVLIIFYSETVKRISLKEIMLE